MWRVKFFQYFSSLAGNNTDKYANLQEAISKLEEKIKEVANDHKESELKLKKEEEKGISKVW